MTTDSARGNREMVENPLCERLQREFRGRGMGAVRGSRTETSVMLERVKRGLNPYEGAPVPEKKAVPQRTADAPRRPAETGAASHPAAQPVHRNAPRPGSGQNAQTRNAAGRPAHTHTGAHSSAVRTNAASPRPAAAKSESRTRALSENQRRERSAAVAAKRASEKFSAAEVRVRAPFPYAAVTMLSIFTIMFMVLLFSFAQNYELTSEISALQAQARTLTQLERDLSVQLEERDDIRVIEDIAVNEIGMVKNDLVESRFVTVSGGDRIELTGNTSEEQDEKKSAGIFSTMLSAIGENFDRLMEYID